MTSTAVSLPAPPHSPLPWRFSPASYGIRTQERWGRAIQKGCGPFRPRPWGRAWIQPSMAPWRWKQALEREEGAGELLFLSSQGDPYSPDYTLPRWRPLLPFILDYGQPVELLTASSRLLRDLNYWKALGQKGIGRVFIYIPRWEEADRLLREPRSEAYGRRWALMDTLAREGVPVGLFLGPSRKEISRKEEEQLIQRAREAGAGWIRRGPYPGQGRAAEGRDEECALRAVGDPWYRSCFRRPRPEQLCLF